MSGQHENVLVLKHTWDQAKTKEWVAPQIPGKNTAHVCQYQSLGM